MNRNRKIGIILILIGIGLPIVLYCFVTGGSSRSVTESIQAMEIVLLQPTWKTVEDINASKLKIAIPYKYILSLNIVALFVGIGLTILSNKKGEQ